MLTDFLNAIPIGVGLSFMIGPVFFVLLETSVLKGVKEAIIFDIGVILADVFFIILAYFGSRQMLEKIKDDPRLFIFGGTILVAYGLYTYFNKKNKIIIEDVDIVIVRKYNYIGLFFKGFFLNFINIGVLAFWLGLIVIIGSNLQMNSHRIFNFFATVVLSYFCTDLVKIFLAKQLKKKLKPGLILKIKKGMGILLIIFGLLLVSKGLFPKEGMNIQNYIEHKIS